MAGGLDAQQSGCKAVARAQSWNLLGAFGCSFGSTPFGHENDDEQQHLMTEEGLMRRSLILGILALSATPAFPQNRTSDETAIRANVAALETGVNKRDYAAIYAADADVIVSDGP